MRREELAAKEIGITTIPARRARILAIGFVLTVAAVPIVDLLSRADLWPRFSFRSNAALLQSVHEYEERVRTESTLTRRLLRPMSRIQAEFGAGNEQAYIGRDGWLFFRPGVDYVTGPGFLSRRALRKRLAEGNEYRAAPQPDPRPAILDFDRQLRARGIRLVVVPTLSKAMLHADRLTRRYASSSTLLQNPSYETFISDLEAAGVEVFDPASVSPEFLIADTHWSPDGLETVAEALARRIGIAPATEYRVQDQKVENAGDIAVMLKMESQFPRQQVRIRRILQWKPDRSAKVLLLGDSYSNIYSLEEMGWGSSAGFAEQLSYELGQPLDRIVRNDAGAYATRLELARDPGRLEGKKIVVWQFAARELSIGDWRIVPLSGKRRPAPAVGVIEGTILAAPGMPAPGSTPYSDAIRALHLRADREMVVFVWGMRKHAWTAAARLGPGDRVRLRLRPWEEVRERYGRYNRIELDDPKLDLPLYWGEIPGQGDPVETFHRQIALRARNSTNNVVEGREGWLFLAKELRALTVGPFWGKEAAGASRASKPEYADPLGPIFDFYRQLREAGIELLLVPVPAKAAIHPDRILGAPPGESVLDPHHQRFYSMLRERGVRVLDLTGTFRESGVQTHCRTDTHWSPAGIHLAADAVMTQLVRRGLFERPDASRFETKSGKSIEILGDLMQLAGGTDREKVSLVSVRDRQGRPAPIDRESPVLLMGDSHVLVFHDPELFGGSAGLPDQLAAQLGFGVDLIGTRGSGSTATRMTLMRRRDNLKGKKVVIWCFSMREFTESFQGWRKVPVIR